MLCTARRLLHARPAPGPLALCKKTKRHFSLDYCCSSLASSGRSHHDLAWPCTCCKKTGPWIVELTQLLWEISETAISSITSCCGVLCSLCGDPDTRRGKCCCKRDRRQGRSFAASGWAVLCQPLGRLLSPDELASNEDVLLMNCPPQSGASGISRNEVNMGGVCLLRELSPVSLVPACAAASREFSCRR